MRATTKAFVGLTTAVGIAAGSLAAAGTSIAAPAQDTRTVAAAEVAPLAVNNLGLSTTRAKYWQCWLRDTGYNPGAIDGQLGTDSWKAAQRKFNDLGYNAGTVDGVVGTNTIKALQRYLNLFDYGLAVDGVAGSQTKAAFSDFNSVNYCA
ncbi:peptidoglycan-binding protein [Streptomyces sp. NPDC000348]|uniref:peptidoglycan-binding domain-containing protein n=1 Tax=Streptomyces sp. NPDC000348 TaxID=3364538 RepID=UPI00368B0423